MTDLLLKLSHMLLLLFHLSRVCYLQVEYQTAAKPDSAVNYGLTQGKHPRMLLRAMSDSIK